jgi:hypothetical protein
VIVGGLNQMEPVESSRKRSRDAEDHCMAMKAMRRMTLAFIEDDLPTDGTGSNAPWLLRPEWRGRREKGYS